MLGGDGPGWTQALAERAHVAMADIPDAVRFVGRTCILDWLAVTIAGSAEPAPRVVRAVAEPGRFDLIGGGTASLTDAVRINGTAGHVLDYDDVHLTLLGHPTAPVLPALLTCAQLTNATGANLLAALVAGIEVEDLLGEWIAWPSQTNGFHTTAQLGILAAAAASSRLLGLSVEQTASAIGLAATAAGGLKSSFGTMGKSMQVGRAASEGLYSALLARAGADAPPNLIEAQSGFAEAYATTVLRGRPDDGTRWGTLKVIFKYYPSCYMTHSSIEGGLELFRAGIDPKEITDVQLTVAPRSAELCDNPHPDTPLEAKFSLSYTVAAAIVTGGVSEESFRDEALKDPRLRALNDKVRTVVVPDHPEFASVVRATTATGEVHEACVDVALPVPADQLQQQWSKVATKARDLVAPLIGAQTAEELIRLVDRIDDLGDLEPVWDICRRPTAPSDRRQ